MRRTCIAAVVSLALATFSPARGEPAKADPARAAIERVGKAFTDAYARGDIAAVANMYAEDAIAFPPDGDMVKGRPAIEAMWKGVRDMGITSLDFEVIDVVSSGNLAAETGKATLHVRGVGSQETTVTVKYVVVYKKTGGTWKLYRDIWNSMGAAPAAAGTAPAGGAADKAMTPEMAMPPPTATTPTPATTPHHH